MDLLTIWAIQALELLNWINCQLIDKLDDYRQKRGMALRSIEYTIDDEQIWALAMSLRLTKKERFKVGELGERVALRNYPWLSRRQCKKVVETFKICRENARKMPV